MSIILMLLFQTLGRTQVDTRSPAPQALYLDAMKLYGERDFDGAHALFLKLAQQGNVDAKAMLGVMYFHGHGVEADRVKSVIWFYQAAQAGRPAAQLVIGKLYLSGDGLTANRGEGAFWLMLARDRGEGDVAENAQSALDKVLPTLPDTVLETIERRVSFWRPVIADHETVG
ncbi:MAG: tetratricopeptide repeat protein [Pseudomonadota bacterium]